MKGKNDPSNIFASKIKKVEWLDMLKIGKMYVKTVDHAKFINKKVEQEA